MVEEQKNEKQQKWNEPRPDHFVYVFRVRSLIFHAPARPKHPQSYSIQLGDPNSNLQAALNQLSAMGLTAIQWWKELLIRPRLGGFFQKPGFGWVDSERPGRCLWQ